MGVEYQAYSGGWPVRKILGYEKGEPVWGETQAVYHPFQSRVISLTTAQYRAWLEPNKSGEAEIKYLRENMLVGVKQEQWEFPQVPLDGGKRTEVYFQTNVNCNLNCFHGGCVADEKKYQTEHRKCMSLEQATGMVHRLVESAREMNFEVINLKYAGGEVTMPQPLKLIRELQPVIAEERQKGGIEIEQTIITNGTYLNKPGVLATLSETGAYIVVSVWGWGVGNDRVRGVRRPDDQFEKVMEGLEKLRKTDIDWNLSLTIHPETAFQVPEIIEYAWGGEKQIPMQIDFWRPMSPLDAEMMTKEGYAKIRNGIRFGLAKMIDLIDRGVLIPPLDKLDFLDPYNLKPSACGMGFNYVAVGMAGLASCHGRLNQGQNWGNIADDQNLIRTANREWGDEDWKQLVGRYMDWGEMSPAARLAMMFHGMGCPWQAKLEKGKMGVASGEVEQVYVPIFEELLAVEMYRQAKLGENNLYRD
jgi:sulfatase maturation enzyme AslB (radical SAM superfamily)